MSERMMLAVALLRALPRRSWAGACGIVLTALVSDHRDSNGTHRGKVCQKVEII
jgi:hypothetical protein